jgi:hypothetical protein
VEEVGQQHMLEKGGKREVHPMLVPTAEPLRPNNANAMHHNDDDDNEDDDSGWVASMLHQSDADRINRGLAPANSLKAVGVVASCCAPTSFHRCNILSYTLLIHTLIHTLSYTFSYTLLTLSSVSSSCESWTKKRLCHRHNAFEPA